MPRDGDAYVEAMPARYRNILLSDTFAAAHASMVGRGAVAGVLFSGWAGEGRKAHALWEEGDALIAEPPTEYHR